MLSIELARAWAIGTKFLSYLNGPTSGLGASFDYCYWIKWMMFAGTCWMCMLSCSVRFL
jgi:hypothetical protein